MFENIEGLYLLGFAVALIILYLIKAKPLEKVMPSLHFFMQDKKIKKYNSILRKLLVRLLFFIQLLFILLLAFAAAKPIMTVPLDAYSLNTVVIMDVSSSMNTVEGTIDRFSEKRDELFKSVKGNIFVILAEENPIVVASNVSASRAKAIISNLEPKDTRTRIDSSILFANELLGEERGNIVVFSDFVLRKDDDILAAKKIAEAADKRVKFIPVGKNRPNLGFVSLNIGRGTGETYVKNFGDRSEVADVRLRSTQKEETKRIEIAPGSVEMISFELSTGDTTLELVQKDRLTKDDTVYIRNPYEGTNSILVISNKKTSPLIEALKSNPLFDVEISHPPVIPDLTYDLVIVTDIDQAELLPNSFIEIKKYKNEGGKVVVALQDNSNSFDFKGLLNVQIGALTEAETEARVDIVNSFTQRISNEGSFASVKKHHKMTINNNSIAIVSTQDNDPLIIMENNVVVYGIIDSYSGFYEQINYPLFWDDLVNSMLGRENLNNFNFHTGDVLHTGNNSLTLYNVGFIDVGSKRVAVNLVDHDESNIYRDSIILNSTEFEDDYQKVNLDLDLDIYLLLLALIVFLYELYYIKRRGDL